MSLLWCSTAGVPAYTTTPYLVSPQDPAVYGMSLTGIDLYLSRLQDSFDADNQLALPVFFHIVICT